jgi:putative intracellular protease/amidase
LTAAGGLEVRAHGGLDLLRRADLVVVPGWRDHRELPPPELLEAIYAAHRRGTRLLSICSGAFVLAATGLLDGRSATTHWRYAQVFRSRFPHVRLLADVLYVDEGDIVTSAGSAAGIDACIHVVRCDYGADIANLVARTMVTPPHRTGGQAQFVPAPIAPRETFAVSPVMDWARARLDQPLRVVDLAKKAAMSERSFVNTPVNPSFETSAGTATVRTEVTPGRPFGTRLTPFLYGAGRCGRRMSDQVAAAERNAASRRFLRSSRMGFTFQGSSASRASTVVAMGRCSKT